MNYFLVLQTSTLVELLSENWGLSQQLRVPAATKMQVLYNACIVHCCYGNHCCCRTQKVHNVLLRCVWVI